MTLTPRQSLVIEAARKVKHKGLLATDRQIAEAAGMPHGIIGLERRRLVDADLWPWAADSQVARKKRTLDHIMLVVADLEAAGAAVQPSVVSARVDRSRGYVSGILKRLQAKGKIKPAPLAAKVTPRKCRKPDVGEMLDAAWMVSVLGSAITNGRVARRLKCSDETVAARCREAGICWIDPGQRYRGRKLAPIPRRVSP